MNIGVAIAGGKGRRDRHTNDFYETPWEATVALMKAVELPSHVWEPACGKGAISTVLEAAGYTVYSSDLIDRGYGEQIDFLKADYYSDAIVTNPPFSLAADFLTRALGRARVVAMLLKATFPNADKRYSLLDAHPPSQVLYLTWRLDFLGLGSPTMDCNWYVWGTTGRPHMPLARPKPSEHPVFA